MRPLAIIGCALLLNLAAAESVRAVVAHHVIAVTGGEAPGGGYYDYFPDLNEGVVAPQLNDNGQVAFFARLTGSSNLGGIFRVGGVTPSMAIAREGEAAPAGGNYDMLNYANQQINASGQVLFWSGLAGSSSPTGIFRHNGTTAIPIALEGEPAPGGGNYGQLWNENDLNDNGQVAYHANVGVTNGIFRHDGAAHFPLVVGAVPAHVGGYGGINSPVYINSSGHVAFVAGVYFNGCPEEEDACPVPRDGIRLHNGATATPVVREWEAAPGGGEYFAFSPSRMQLNDSDQIAYYAVLTNESGFTDGYFLHNGTIDIAIALQGSPAPAGGNYNFFGANHDLQLNSGGEVAYGAVLTGGSSMSGVFRHDGTIATTVALEGMAAPGTSGTFYAFDNIRMNDDGLIAFYAYGYTEEEEEFSGIWVGTDASNLSRLVGPGDMVNLNGTNRELFSLDSFSMSEEGIAWTGRFYNGHNDLQAVIYTEFDAEPVLPDYNDDGTIGAADYVAWRKIPSLFGGDPTGYDDWQTHFAEPATGAARLVPGSQAPEPSALLLIITAATWFISRPRQP